MAIFRGFIAIDIHPTPPILQFEKDIEKTGADVKLVEPKNIHITLKFLGDTNEDHLASIQQAMKESVKGITPFPITLTRTGVFPNQNYIKVVWIGIHDGGIINTIVKPLNFNLQNLGFQKEHKDFSPHLTVGRVKTARNKDHLLNVIAQYNTLEFTSQKVHSIRLKKSELTPRGPIYTTLAEVPVG